MKRNTQVNYPVKYLADDVWRPLTPREKLLQVAKNEQEKKTLNTVADIIEKTI